MKLKPILTGHILSDREKFDDAIEKAKGETLGLGIERKGTQVEALQLQNNEGSPSPYVSNTSHVSLAEGGNGLRLQGREWET